MNVKDLIIEHEAVRLKPYRDTVGKLTIGVGRNLDDNGITQLEAMYLLDNDISDVMAELVKLPWFGILSPVRQAVLVDMAFNMGVATLMTFHNTLEHIQDGEYDLAANSMFASKWASQVGKRAAEDADMMRSGAWPDDR